MWIRDRAKAPWAAAYGIDAADAITYAIDEYSATVNEGTYTCLLYTSSSFIICLIRDIGHFKEDD